MSEAPWRRRIGTAPKTWVAAMAVGACLGWLPMVGRSLGPDEAGFLIVGSQWSDGASLYGDYWVDRPPVLIALFEAADALGGGVTLRLLGTLAVVLSVLAAGVLGRLAAPERRSAPLLTAGTAAVFATTPLFGGGNVNGEVLGLPFLVAGMAAYVAAACAPSRGRALAWSVAAGAAGALGALVKQSLVDVFVLVAVLALTDGRARRRLPGLITGAVATGAIVVCAAWLRGTAPTDLFDAVVTFRLDAARELAGTSGNSAPRLAGLLGSLAGSGLPILVGVLVWKGRGAPSHQGRSTPPDLRAASLVLLVWELLVVLLGGSYWMHYLTGLVPGAVLVAAAFAQRPAPVTRSVGAAFGLAAASTVVVVGWVAVHPTDRDEAPAIAYLGAEAQPGDTAVVVFGAANVLRDADLNSPYPYLWSLPARVRDGDLTELVRVLDGPDRPRWVVVAYGSVDDWGLDFGAAQAELDADYEPVTEAGKFTIYRRDDR